MDTTSPSVADLEFFSWGCQTFSKYILNCANKLLKLLIEIVVNFAWIQWSGAGSSLSKDTFYLFFFIKNTVEIWKNKTLGGVEPATCDTLLKYFSTMTSKS